MHRASLSHLNIQNKHLLICNHNYPCHYIKPLSTGIPCHLNSCNVLFMSLMKVNCCFVVVHNKTKVFGSHRSQEPSNLHNQSSLPLFYQMECTFMQNIHYGKIPLCLSYLDYFRRQHKCFVNFHLLQQLYIFS